MFDVSMRTISFSVLILVFYILLGVSSAQIPLRGPQSGTLEAEIYHVIDTISVLEEDSLVIQPGAVFIFQGSHRFYIYGYLRAEGTEADSIFFLPDPNFEGGWGSVIFQAGSSDSSRLAYCYFTGAFASAVNIYHTGVSIFNCTVTGNRANWGGGIYCSGNSTQVPIRIFDCVVTDNWCVHNGGGIYCTRCPVIIKNCVVTGNYCNMAGSGSGMGGGGICHNHGATGRIERCLVANNYTGEYGGGISCNDNSNSTIINCTVYGNEAGYSAGGIFVGFSSVMIVNTMINFNRGPAGIGVNNSPEARIEFCSFYKNKAGYVRGNTIPSEIGVLALVNFNGDSCDEYYNIFMDPLLENPLGGDFRLQDGSTCIDAGSPETPLDPDGTVPDIGAYYFHQNPVSLRPAGEVPEGFIIFSAYPNPFNASTALSFKLQAASQVRLAIYDIAGREVAVLVDGFRRAGRHRSVWEASGAPSGLYFASLRISNRQVVRKLMLLK